MKIISFIFNQVKGRMPEENESVDAFEIKKICKDYLKNKKGTAYYDQVSKFAEKKIKQIEFIEDQENKLKKLAKNKKSIVKK